jgi:hypothetical protein
VGPTFGGVISGATPVPAGRQAQDLMDAVVAGVQDSATGLALRGKMPSVVRGEDAPWYHRFAAGMGNVIADIPLSVVGALGGAAGGTAAGGPGLGTTVGGAAGAFAAPMALRDALIAAYNGNHALSWSGVWDIAWAGLKGGAKGAVIGGVTGGAGKLAAPFIAPAGAAATAATGSALAGKLAVGVGQAGVELTALTGTAAALEGQLPTSQDFMDNAILLGGMKGATAVARGMRNIYAQTGRTPEQVMADAMANAEIKASLAKGETPRAYEPLVREEYVKAAYEPRPEFIRKSMDVLDKALKLDPNELAGDPVKYEYVVDSTIAKSVTRLLADEYNAAYAKKTRGVVPNAQSALEGLKSVVGGTLPDHAAGWAGNAGEIAARAHLLRGASNVAMRDLAELRATPEIDVTPQMKLRAAASLDRVAMLHGEFLGVRAEAGRSLQILGAIKRDPSFLGEAEALLAAIEKKKGNLLGIAALAEGFKTPAELVRYAESFQKATTLEMVIEGWKASILSGPMTFIANPLGNTVKWLVDIPESAIAATLFAAERKLQGDPLTWAQYKVRALSPLYGMQLGALDGLKLAAEILRGQEADFTKVDQFRGARIPGPVGKVTGTIFAGLSAQDALVRVPAERSRALILAVDRLVKEGVHPDTAEGRSLLAQYIERPEFGLSETAGQKALAKIRQAGLEASFSQRQGPHLEMAMRAVSGTWAEFVFPFRNTPANLFSWAVQHTPGLFLLSPRWRADWSAGGERQAGAMARAVVGAGLTATAFALAQDGAITGGMLYLTPEQRAARIAAGEQPYSARLFGKYYSYQRIEPVSKVLGVATDLVELAVKTKDEQDNAKIAMLLVALFGNATISTTYMSGLSNAMQALVDPVRRGENFLEQYAMSLIPKAVGQTATILDPHKREIEGVVDAIQSQIPIFRERLLPKRDAWGTPAKSGRWLEVMPIATSEASKDKVRTEAARLSIAIADAPKFLTERGPFNQTDKRVKLEPEQRDIIREVSGTHAMNILAPIVNAPDWKGLPEYVKVSIFNDVIGKTRKIGIQEAAPADDPRRIKKRQDIIDRINREWQAVNPK